MSFSWPNQRRAAVSITFDDGRASQLDQGIPLLDRYGIRGTFYVKIEALAKRLEDWRAASERGHEIGNHTLTHPCSGNYPFSRNTPLEDYTLEGIEADILEANRRIEHAVGRSATTFAYPCGQYFLGRGQNTVSYIPVIARHFLAGRAFYTPSGNDPAFCDLARLQCRQMDRLPPEEAAEAVEQALQQGSWLVLGAHEVAPQGRQSVSPETLEAVCEACARHSDAIWADTVDAVGRWIRDQREGG
jgi:peptidoglycan/xylan/chitin deacetylase (PgdA/CDA1 family)